MALPREEFLRKMKEGRERAKAEREAQAVKAAAAPPTEKEEKVAETLIHSVTGEAPTKPQAPVKTAAPAVKTKYNWWKLSGAVALAVIGLLVLVLGNASQNAVLIVAGAAVITGGGWLGISTFQGAGGQRVIKGKVVLKAANCVVISSGRVDFINEPDAKKLYGLPAQCVNDGKYYYLHFKGLDGNGSISPLTLPDPDPSEQYYDPKEALNCLRMPLSKRYFNYMPSTTGVVSIVVMGVIIGAEIIGLIAMGG